jgi:hypothetical protein
MRLTPLLLALPIWPASLDPQLQKILDRVSEEAEVFHQSASRLIASERLLHRGRKSPPRIRMSTGADPQLNTLGYLEREIISEYGFASFKEAPESIREFRQVVSVDGRQVAGLEKARETLTMNIKSDDDRLRKKMLQEFERHAGLVGAATDFGQIILMFRRRALDRYEFTLPHGRKDTVGLEKVAVVSYRQKESKDGARVFHGRQMTIIPTRGEIWVRESDLLPLRIIVVIPSIEDKMEVIHTGEADYEQTRFGILLPRAVRYTRKEGGLNMVENFAFYSDYRMFKVETNIRFTPEEVQPK